MAYCPIMSLIFSPGGDGDIPATEKLSGFQAWQTDDSTKGLAHVWHRVQESKSMAELYGSDA
jgi:hypothetical protein